MMSRNVIAIDRSGSSAARTASEPTTTRKGSNPFDNRDRVPSACFFTSNIDVQTMTANFASSDGWIDPPNRKRRDPWMRGAMRSVKGSTVSSINASAPAMSGHAHRRQRSASTFAAIANTTTPTAAPLSCFSR